MATRIGIGSDHAGYTLKEHLGGVLRERGFEVLDYGVDIERRCDYPDFAHLVAKAVAGGDVDQGLLVCGSGVGMSITANRHAGVRAVVCSEPYSARMARAHNDANVLCVGARVVGQGLAEEILDTFLAGTFEGGRHAGRVAKIDG